MKTLLREARLATLSLLHREEPQQPYNRRKMMPAGMRNR